MTPPTVVFWDIDGTLLTTARAGIAAWEDAVREVLAVDSDLAAMKTSGLTDCMIARELMAMAGQEPDPALERELARVYTDALPERLTQKRGRVLPGVRDILELLAGRSDTVLALLTGNMRAGAWAKLESYGLSDYFDAGGFADDGFERAEIGRVAVDQVASAFGPLDVRRVFLVGDSPYDVGCARVLGMRMIAVASGEHTLEDLHATEPWWVMEQLPDAREFLLRVGVDAPNDRDVIPSRPH